MKYELSIIVPVFNNLDLTKQVVKCINETQQDIKYELVIVNDGSTDGTEKRLKANKKTNRTIINQENQGVTKAWNIGVEKSTAEYIAVINNDIILPQGAFKKLIKGFTDESIVMCCPRSTNANTRIYSDQPYYFQDHIHGRCYVINKKAKNKLFPLDTRMKIFGSDNWLYFKMIYMGYKMKLKVDVIIHHLESQTVDVTKNFDRPIFLAIAKQEGRYVRPHHLKNDCPGKDLIRGL